MSDFFNYGGKKEDFFECETKGVISDSILQNWTIGAYDCYKIKSNCASCPIKNGHYSFKCKMKEVVKELLKTQGLPNEKALNEEKLEEAKNSNYRALSA